MRYINKNQITEFLIEESDEIDVIEKYNISIFIENQTKEECIALAEKLGLTLID